MQQAARASARQPAALAHTRRHSRLHRRAFAMPLDRTASGARQLQAAGTAGPADSNVVAEHTAAGSSGATPRVLSIQSHVVHGFVGNKCAVFPLQLLGFDVDPVMSVQFSNHTGYPTFKGHVFEGGHLTELLAGLEANGLLQYSHLLTGYIGSLSLLQAVKEAALKLKEANPKLVYVCDPVMGDEGRMYVTEQLLDTFRSDILPLATLLTPNDFEAELLTGRSIHSVEEAVEAAAQLHAMGPPTVVITSMSAPAASAPSDPSQQPQQASSSGTTSNTNQQLPNGNTNMHDSSSRDASSGEHASISSAGSSSSGSTSGTSGSSGSSGADSITLVASTVLPQRPGQPQRFTVTVPRLNGYYTGTGDLLSALLLAWTHRHPDDLATAVSSAVAGLQGVLRATAASADPGLLTSKERSAEVFRARELRLVENRHCLERPLEPGQVGWPLLRALP